MSKIEFSGQNPESVFSTASRYADGGPVAVIAMQTSIDWSMSDGVIGHASSWKDAVRVLHERGYRLLRKGGEFSAYCGREQGIPEEAAVIIVTVFPTIVFPQS